MGEDEGGMIWENGIETYILPYVKQMTSPSSMHETGHSKPRHWDNLEGWDGERGGRGVQDGGHVYPWLIHVNNVWQKPLQYCKIIGLQLKWIIFFKFFTQDWKAIGRNQPLIYFVVVQSLSNVWLLPSHGLQHARLPLCSTNSQSLLKLIAI